MAGDDGQGALAVRLLAAAQGVRALTGCVRSPAQEVAYRADLDTARTAMDSDAFDTAWSEGMSLAPEEAVAYALRGRGRRLRPASGWDSLTPAEAEVVRLVREGLTNPEIGRRLFVSPRTVGHHLANVYRKLGVHSRAALHKGPGIPDSPVPVRRR